MSTGAEPRDVCRMGVGSGGIEIVKFGRGRNVEETFSHIFEHRDDMAKDVF